MDNNEVKKGPLGVTDGRCNWCGQSTTAERKRDELVAALKITAGNIRSLGPAGALDVVPMPYREWLDVVDSAIAKTEANK